jgi:hypothetical protein
MMDAAEIKVDPVIQASQVKGTQSAGIRVTHRWVLAAILGVTFLAYAGTMRFGFVYDDVNQIAENPGVQSWQFAPGYFVRSVWDHQDGHAPGNYYRPIFLLWLLINYMLFGLDPSLWHLTTIITHVVVTLMIYQLAHRLMKDHWVAVVAAMVFGLHPVHIEATAWISGVTESLLALMFIPSLVFYLKRRDEIAQARETNLESLSRARWRRLGLLAASLVFYALALLSKETAIALPLIIFSYEWIFARSSKAVELDEVNEPRSMISRLVQRVITALKPTVPFLAVTAFYLLARAMVLKAILHPLRSDTATKLQIVLTAPSIILFYIKQLVWPVGLSGFYDLEPVKSPLSFAFLMPVAVLILIAIALWWAIRRLNDATDRRVACFALAVILMPILPVLNIAVFRPGELVHDRYLYLPSIGFSILIALALRRINLGRAKLFGQPAFQIASVLVLAGSLGFATAFQHIHWSNDLLLYQHGLSVAPNSSVARNNLGDLLSKRGLYAEAVVQFHRVVEKEPNFWEAIYNLGYNYYKLGKYKEAEPWLRLSTEIHQTNANQYLTLGVVLFETNRLDEAEAALRHGIGLRQNGYGLHYALGAVLKTKGNLPAALDEFKMELEYNPRYQDANEQIAKIEQQLGPVTENRAK